MKKTFIILFLISTSNIIIAQNWHKDLKEAKEEASKNDNKIILVFSGSDWCAPCIKLDREIWDTEVFKSYAKDNYVLLKADFPRKKKNKLPREQEDKNKILAEKFNKKGHFPLVVVLDKEEKVLGKLGYMKKSPKEYIELLNSF